MTTTNKPNRQCQGVKVTPKRAVSFSPNVKPEAPTRLKPKSDGELQAVGKRRRYMRRGSKCPSMLRASFATIRPILIQTYAAADAASVGGCSPLHFDVKMVEANAQAAKRRMSLMTALKVSLENTTIVDQGQVPKKAERRLSQLLSRV